MRLATFNVENLFDRPRVMNLDTWAEGKSILENYADLNTLLGELDYTLDMKAQMVKLMVEIGLAKSDKTKFVILRHNRGKLLKRGKDENGDTVLTIVANGRADWAGTLELVDEPVDEVAMHNTARVINEVNADVLAVVEAESRPVLSAFNTQLLTSMGGKPYRHVMVIDGNDQRGIDVGLMTRADYPIERMRSHVDDCDAAGASIFSRDCPEYEVRLADGRSLWILPNHFKSKGYGTDKENNARRRLQAGRVVEIYLALRKAGEEYVAIVGDLNDTPDSKPLAPLHQEDLRDISTHKSFDNGGYPGTYGGSTASNKIDYILLSPALFDKVSRGGIFRKGMWPGVRRKKWDVFAELSDPSQAASDHGLIWADLEL